MELFNNPYFVLLAFVLIIVLGYVLRHQENVPGFLFIFVAGMGAFYSIANLQKLALLKGVILFGLMPILLVSRFSRGQTLPWLNLALLISFMAVVLLSGWLNNVDFDLLRGYVGTLIIALVVAMCPNNEKTSKHLIVAIALWGGFNLLAAVFQWAGHGWIYSGDALHTDFRVLGLMGISNVMGVYFVIALNAVHVLYFQVRSKIAGLLLFALGLGLAVGLLGTLSRASFIAWLISSLYIQYRLRGIRIGGIIGVLTAAVIVLVLATLLNLDKMMAVRFSSIESDPSAQYRAPLVEMAMKLFEEKPFFGVGLSQGGLGQLNVLVNSHNTFVQVLMENGVVGFTLFILLLWRVSRGLMKRARDASMVESKPYYVGLLAMLGSVLLNGLFHDLSYLMPLWVLIGIGLLL